MTWRSIHSFLYEKHWTLSNIWWEGCLSRPVYFVVRSAFVDPFKAGHGWQGCSLVVGITANLLALHKRDDLICSSWQDVVCDESMAAYLIVWSTCHHHVFECLFCITGLKNHTAREFNKRPKVAWKFSDFQRNLAENVHCEILISSVPRTPHARPRRTVMDYMLSSSNDFIMRTDAWNWMFCHCCWPLCRLWNYRFWLQMNVSWRCRKALRKVSLLLKALPANLRTRKHLSLLTFWRFGSNES